MTHQFVRKIFSASNRVHKNKNKNNKKFDAICDQKAVDFHIFGCFIICYSLADCSLPETHICCSFRAGTHFLTLHILIFLLFFTLTHFTRTVRYAGCVLLFYWVYLPIYLAESPGLNSLLFSPFLAIRFLSFILFRSYHSFDASRFVFGEKPFSHIFMVHVFSVPYMFAIVRTHQPIFTHSRISFFVRALFSPYFT